MSVPHLAADNPDILLPRPVCGQNGKGTSASGIISGGPSLD